MANDKDPKKKGPLSELLCSTPTVTDIEEDPLQKQLDVQQTPIGAVIRDLIQDKYTHKISLQGLRQGIVLKVIAEERFFDYTLQKAELEIPLAKQGDRKIPYRYKVFLKGIAGSIDLPPEDISDFAIWLLPDYTLNPNLQASDVVPGINVYVDERSKTIMSISTVEKIDISKYGSADNSPYKSRRAFHGRAAQSQRINRPTTPAVVPSAQPAPAQTTTIQPTKQTIAFKESWTKKLQGAENTNKTYSQPGWLESVAIKNNGGENGGGKEFLEKVKQVSEDIGLGKENYRKLLAIMHVESGINPRKTNIGPSVSSVNVPVVDSDGKPVIKKDPKTNKEIYTIDKKGTKTYQKLYRTLTVGQYSGNEYGWFSEELKIIQKYKQNGATQEEIQKIIDKQERNASKQGKATGLIQFLGSTANEHLKDKEKHWTYLTDAKGNPILGEKGKQKKLPSAEFVYDMNGIQQLDLVKEYFEDRKRYFKDPKNDKYRTVTDLYIAVWQPILFTKEDDYAIGSDTDKLWIETCIKAKIDINNDPQNLRYKNIKYNPGVDAKGNYYESNAAKIAVENASFDLDNDRAITKEEFVAWCAVAYKGI